MPQSKLFSAITLWLNKGLGELANAHVVNAGTYDCLGNSFGTDSSVSLQGSLGLECGVTGVTREGVSRCNVSCKAAASSKALPTQSTLRNFNQAHKIVGLICVVLKLCVAVESEVTVFTLEKMRLPKMFGESNPSVDGFSASVAVEWSRRCFTRLDNLLLTSGKAPTLLMDQESMSEEVSLSWEPKFTLLAGNDILTSLCAIVNDHSFHERDVCIVHCDNFWNHGGVSTTEIGTTTFLTIF